MIREICFIGTPITEGAFCSAAIARPLCVLLRRFPPSWKVQIARKSAAIDPTASDKQDDLKLTVECRLCRPALCGVRKGLEGKVWRMMTWIFWPSGFEQIDHGSLGSVHHQRGKSGVQSLQEPGCGCGWWNMCIEKRRTGRTGAMWRRDLEFNTVHLARGVVRFGSRHCG